MPTTYSTHCPACSAPLRIRDPRYFGTTIPCPDCSANLFLERTDDDQARARLVEEPTAAKPVRFPYAMSIAALGATAIIGGLVLNYAWNRPASSPSRVDLAANPVPTGRDPSEPRVAHAAPMNAPTTTSSNSDDHAEAPAARIDPPTATVSSRLSAIGEALATYERERSSFPAGAWIDPKATAGSPPWSWHALLPLAQARVVVAEVPWSRGPIDPATDRFVRRSIPAFQNPALPPPVGDDMRPGTHFVGIAGWTKEGPRVAANDPRAGVFAEHRSTRRDDLVDGASSTWMVGGVTTGLASWAASGPGAIRPLTQPPFVNGPDGFGTGDPRRMTILLADGSVKDVAVDVDPIVLRRMATIADGAPLDASVPDRPEPTSAPPAVVDKPPVAEPAVDLRATLSQPIVRYRQARAVSRRDVLLSLEELIGARLPWSDAKFAAVEAGLSKTTTFDLRDVTVHDVLNHVLGELNLTAELADGKIVVRPLVR